MPENYDYLKCPFCENWLIDAKSGKTGCSVCYAEFEVDDRFECIFADTEKIRLPANGIVCGSCGLIQGGNNQNCLFCGIRFIL